MTTTSDQSESYLKRIFTDKSCQTDFTDAQNEATGYNPGKIERFYPDASPTSIAAKQEKQRKEFLTQLQLALAQDKDFARLYARVDEMLRDAEILTEQSLQAACEELARHTKSLASGIAKANMLPDGTAVFMDENGDIITENQRKLEPDEIASLSWKDGAISYEEYLARKQAVEETVERIERLRHYQVDTLGHMRQRMHDTTDVVTKDELEGFQDILQNKEAPIAEITLDNDVSLRQEAPSPQGIPALKLDGINI